MAELFETSTGDGGVEVDTLEERVDFDGGLRGGREGTLGTLASGTKPAESTRVGREIWNDNGKHSVREIGAKWAYPSCASS